MFLYLHRKEHPDWRSKVHGEERDDGCFWDVVRSSPVDIHWRLRGAYCLQSSGRLVLMMAAISRLRWGTRRILMFLKRDASFHSCDILPRRLLNPYHANYMEVFVSWGTDSRLVGPWVLSILLNQQSVTLFTRARHWPLSWAIRIHSTSLYSLFLRSILILSFYLCLCLPSDIFSLGFPVKKSVLIVINRLK
jgi:hypothetical protein